MLKIQLTNRTKLTFSLLNRLVNLEESFLYKKNLHQNSKTYAIGGDSLSMAMGSWAKDARKLKSSSAEAE